MTMHERADLLKRLLAERILMLDGAMGTMIQSYKLTESDYRGNVLPIFRMISKATMICSA